MGICKYVVLILYICIMESNFNQQVLKSKVQGAQIKTIYIYIYEEYILSKDHYLKFIITDWAI